MTPTIRTTEAGEHLGERVRLRGWLHATRSLGGITFLVLRDGWGTIQLTIESEEGLRPLHEAGAMVESVIEAEGLLRAEPRAPGGFELVQVTLGVISPVTSPVPVSINKTRLKAQQATLLNHAPLTLRHPERRAIFKLSALTMAGFRQTLQCEGFTEVQTPKIVASATESGANVFEIDYFGQRAFLAQSPQFYKQTMVGIFERVFEVGPVFRAEPHATPRHINEYVSLDVEMGFVENHFTVMAMLREVLAGIMVHLETHAQQALELLKITLPEVPRQIPHLHFEQARVLLAEIQGGPVLEEPDLSPSEERLLGQWAQQEHGSAFVFVTGYPMSKRPFYTHPQPGAPQWSNSFDLLFRGTELVTGGQRLHRPEDYHRALEQAGLPRAPFASYLEAFECGMPPHGGFAIGLERFVMQLVQAPNLRLTTLFPRDKARLTP